MTKDENGNVKWAEVSKTFAVPVVVGVLAAGGSIVGNKFDVLEVKTQMQVSTAEIRGLVAGLTIRVSTVENMANATQTKQSSVVMEAGQIHSRQDERLNQLEREIMEIKRRGK